MNNIIRVITVSSSFIIGMSVAGIAHAESDTGTAAATIGSSMTVANGTDINFGTIIPDSSASTVELTSGGTYNISGNATVITNGAVGTVNVSNGTANEAVTITVDDGASGPVVLTGAGDPMPAALVGSGCPTLDGSGACTITIAGVLNVGANQSAGAYTGTYTVTEEYTAPS